MNIEQMLSILDADIVERLKTAVEIGKWPNGGALTAEQRQTCMQAVIAWEHQNPPAKERTGYYHKGHKEKDEESGPNEPEPKIHPSRFI